MTFGEKALTRADLGRERTDVWFAWLPTRLSDGRRAWLERIIVTRAVVKGRHLLMWPDMFPDAWNPEWQTIHVSLLREELG